MPAQTSKAPAGDGFAGIVRGIGGHSTTNGEVRFIPVIDVTARAATINQIKAMLVAGPESLRARYRGLSNTKLTTALAATRPPAHPVTAEEATAYSLRVLARRYRMLSDQVTDLKAQLTRLLEGHAPALMAVSGAGPDTVSQLLITAGDNPARLRTEAHFAALAGACPIPASSGKTNRHRLNRAGDRQANSALYHIVIVRMRHHQPTREYVTPPDRLTGIYRSVGSATSRTRTNDATRAHADAEDNSRRALASAP